MDIDAYLAPLTPNQEAGILAVRGLVLRHHPELVEKIDEGKWFGGMLTYTSPEGTFCFALGPRKDGSTSFHMMPYYCSKTLQERHGTSLKKFLTGKSCIKFKRYEDLPSGALDDIVGQGLQGMIAALAQRSSK